MTNHICIFVLLKAPTYTNKTANTNGRLNRSTTSERLLLWWFDIVCQQARTLASSTRSLSPHNHHAVHHIIIFIMRARVSYRTRCFSIGQHAPASHQPPLPCLPYPRFSPSSASPDVQFCPKRRSKHTFFAVFCKKVAETFGGMEKSPYLCSRKREREAPAMQGCYLTLARRGSFCSVL